MAKDLAGKPLMAAAGSAHAGPHANNCLVSRLRREEDEAAEGADSARPLLGLGVASHGCRDFARKLGTCAESACSNRIFRAAANGSPTSRAHL